MKFTEFKEKIENIYRGKFPDSLINCEVFKGLGRMITIECYLVKDNTEAAHKILNNDLMSVLFTMHMPDGWNEENDLPEELTMESLKNSITVKPTVNYLYCDYKKPTFRKTKGNAGKIIKAFDKYTDRLYSLLEAEYRTKNLLDRDMELVEKKGYFEEA